VSTCIVVEDNITRTWHRTTSFLLPFVHLGPKEVRVGRVMSGGWVVAAGKAVFGRWWGKVGVEANIK
jgi:hypothetical protein